MKLKVKNKCEILFLKGKEVITELSSINTKIVIFQWVVHFRTMGCAILHNGLCNFAQWKNRH